MHLVISEFNIKFELIRDPHDRIAPALDELAGSRVALHPELSIELTLEVMLRSEPAVNCLVLGEDVIVLGPVPDHVRGPRPLGVTVHDSIIV